MVNPGKRSAGCYTCRKRRVKCDERKPTCARCEKANRQCAGYPAGTDLVFRNENHIAQRNALLDLNISKKKRATEPDLAVDSSSGAGQIVIFDQRPESTSEISYVWTPPYSRTPLPPSSVLEMKVLPPNGGHVMLCHMYMTEKTSQNLSLRLARDLQLQAAPTSALNPLAESIAWINAPVGYDHRHVIFNATKLYNKAITSLRRTIASPTPAPLNETMVIILWMTKAEMAISPPDAVGSVVLSHVKGALSFLRASTKINPLPSLYAPTLIELINNMVSSWITAPTHIAMELGKEFEYVQQLTGCFSQLPEGTLGLVQLGMTAAQIHTELKFYRNTAWSEVTRADLKSLYAKCAKARAIISEWAYLWTPGGFALSADEKDRLFGAITVWNTHKENISLWERKDWGQICTYRLLTYICTRQCAKKYLELADSERDSTRDPFGENLISAENAMKEATDRMIWEIREYMRTYLTGDIGIKSPSEMESKSTPRIGSYMMILPLRIANSLKDLSEQARGDLRDAIHMIVQYTGLPPEFWIPRLKGNIFD
ncbi:hypothetical protein EJ05DRAFT_63735 [Pseudovirgaria hyperparasitica]|uniref:Zn(2)-C6 fungal-type domain-containing protein n=1 Tax=Pseudovirgaria hyperparasitica TaxID=470096 RepID=A0A6A6W373_9PEZI|nr:uncharacterized protein EJ05DRAFT_63735 [Pseudovirgaria hyperparasitica]KAF2756380.1 hypothetical protein EJ05DRAFT_63735 [Pseudovirgaria hyperparasitica]